jgi:tryptophan synthase beta chain
MSDETVKYLLPESEIPTHWINLLPDLPGEPLPPLHPGTLQPAGPDDLTPIFPMSLILQEVSADPQVEIPEPVRDAYKLWRPTPLFRARRWERALDTPAHIYYKYEGVSPAGSHKPNTAVAGCQRRPARGSGAPRSRSRARCSASSARCSWSARAMTRSPTAAR